LIETVHPSRPRSLQLPWDRCRDRRPCWRDDRSPTLTSWWGQAATPADQRRRGAGHLLRCAGDLLLRRWRHRTNRWSDRPGQDLGRGWGWPGHYQVRHLRPGHRGRPGRGIGNRQKRPWRRLSCGGSGPSIAGPPV